MSFIRQMVLIQWHTLKIISSILLLNYIWYNAVKWFIRTDKFSVRVISKACKPDNFESYSSLKLSFMNIRGLWIFLIVNLSMNQTLLIFLLCETNHNDSIDSSNFSVRGFLPLIRKDSSTHMHGLAVYVKEDCLSHGTYI